MHPQRENRSSDYVELQSATGAKLPSQYRGTFPSRECAYRCIEWLYLRRSPVRGRGADKRPAIEHSAAATTPALAASSTNECQLAKSDILNNGFMLISNGALI